MGEGDPQIPLNIREEDKKHIPTKPLCKISHKILTQSALKHAHEGIIQKATLRAQRLDKWERKSSHKP